MKHKKTLLTFLMLCGLFILSKPVSAARVPVIKAGKSTNLKGTIINVKYSGAAVTMANKLSNIRSMARDYLLVGEELWQRFNMKDREKQAWYYTSMIDLLKDLNETPEYQEYVRLCGKVFGGIAGCCSLQNI